MINMVTFIIKKKMYFTLKNYDSETNDLTVFKSPIIPAHDTGGM